VKISLPAFNSKFIANEKFNQFFSSALPHLPIYERE
jgi:hypothetical protein